MLNVFIERLFDQEINEVFKGKDEIRTFLINHERKKLVIGNLTKEIKLSELSGHTPSRQGFTKLVKDCARMFCEAALEQRKQQLLSRAEMQRLKAEATKIETIKAQFEEDQKEATTDVVKVFT